MRMEPSFVMLKPDAVARGLVGEVLKRFESKGFKIKALKLINMSRGQAEELYAEHKGKPFYKSLIDLATSGPCVVTVIEGVEGIRSIRDFIGKTNPRDAGAGTIRGDLGMGLPKNVIHASDSLKSAEREIRIYFQPAEILEYPRCCDDWLGEE